MKRKVVLHGPNTLGVSFPRKWVKRVGIRKGDEVSVEEQGKALTIGSDKEVVTEATIKIPDVAFESDKVKEPERYIIRTIVINALRKGHDKIRIKIPSASALPIISRCVDEVIGYEVTEQNPDECLVENVVKFIDKDFDKHLNKFRFVISNFATLIEERVLKNKENLPEIRSNFLMLEKNYNTLCRFLMTLYHEKPKEKIFLFAALEHLYQGARNLYYSTQFDAKLRKDTQLFASNVFSYVKDVMKYIGTKDTDRIAQLNLRKNKLYHQANKILLRSRRENPIILQLSFVARRFWDVVGPYTGSII